MCSSLPLSRVDPSSVGLLSCAAFMGAPVIISEKLVAGVETSLALEALQRVLASGVCGEEEGRRGSESVRVRERQLSGGKKAWIADPDDLKKIDVSDPSQINLVSLKILHIIYLSSAAFQFYNYTARIFGEFQKSHRSDIYHIQYAYLLSTVFQFH